MEILLQDKSHFLHKKEGLQDKNKGYVLARAGEEIFHRFLGEVCHHGPLDPGQWQGHPTHEMTRTGNSLECQRCHLRTRILNDQMCVTPNFEDPAPSL